MFLNNSVQFSRSIVSNSWQPHEPQHARPPCPSPNPRVHPNPCPLSRWCHPSISSSVIPFSSPQHFPASGSFHFFFLLLLLIFFFFNFILFLNLNHCIILPNIKTNPPQVYMCSPSWTLLPPPSPHHPSGSSQCTSPKHPVSCIEPGLFKWVSSSHHVAKVLEFQLHHLSFQWTPRTDLL